MDIALELLEKIEKEFKKNCEKNGKIAELLAKINGGKGTPADSGAYAIEVGEELARAFGKFVTGDVLPNGKMYYNIAEKLITPLLEGNFKLVKEAASRAVKNVYENAGLGLNARTVKADKERIKGVVKYASEAEEYERVRKSVEDTLVNYTQSVNDEVIKRNMEFAGGSGLDARVVRTAEAKCCEWCAALEGVYEYPAPRDVYRRHENCRCEVEYVVGRRKQNVHSKVWRD